MIFAGLIGAIFWNLADVVLRPAVELLARAHRRRRRRGVRGGTARAPSRRDGLLEKVLVPALVAPVVAFLRGRAARSSSPTGWSGACIPAPSTAATGWGRSSSGSLLSLSHGTNDAQKTMGIITLALVAHGELSRARTRDPPIWVIVSAATAIALGTYSGGWRIIRTMGSRIIKMDPAQGFARAVRRLGRDPDRRAPRLPALDDALDHRRGARRRRRQAPVRRALGARGQHLPRVGPHAAVRRRRRRRSRTASTRIFGEGALGPVLVSVVAAHAHGRGLRQAAAARSRAHDRRRPRDRRDRHRRAARAHVGRSGSRSSP